MVQVSYPGVYVQEKSSGVHTITGVSTSVAAFFGRATEGPVNKAVRCLSYADFSRTYGAPHPKSQLALQVKLFFDNGGTECYIVRVNKAGTGTAASVTIKNEANSKSVLKFDAKEIGTWGNQVSIDIDYNTPQPEDTFNATVYRYLDNGTLHSSEEFRGLSMDPDSSKFAPTVITQQSKLVKCTTPITDFTTGAPNAGFSQSRRLFSDDDATATGELKAEITSSVNALSLYIDGQGPYDVTLDHALIGGAANLAAIAAQVKVDINKALPSTLQDSVHPSFETVTIGTGAGATDHNVLQLTAATTDKKSVFVEPAGANDCTTALMLGTDQGGIEVARYSVLRPAPSGLSFYLKSDLSNLNVFAGADQISDDLRVEIDGTSAVVDGSDLETVSGGKWYQSATTPPFDGVREKFNIIAKAVNDAAIGWKAISAGSRIILQKTSGSLSEAPVLKLFTGAPEVEVPGVSAYLPSNTRRYALGSTVSAFVAAGTAGAEGDAPEVADYKGKEAGHTGFYALDTVDIFNLMIIPRDEDLMSGSDDERMSLWGAASIYCRNHRAFLLIDPPETWKDDYKVVTGDAAKGIKKVRQGLAKDFAAVFYPRITVRVDGASKNVGPSGAMAGLMARTDSTRGVWKAPAGTDATLFNVEDVELNLTDLENGVLNKQAVNCIRKFSAGIVSWGARTVDGADDFGSEWKYIPIRRLALYIEESLFRGTKWVVFEPNDEPLWAKIRLNVGAFMKRLFREGAFQGDTPDKAYYVKCDSETTTQSDRNLGIVNIQVGFAPLKPAEFVVITIQQIAGEL